jgi:hypothetical protein
MSTTSTSTSSGGIGLAGALGILFVALKLLDKIDWSWWWVLAPFWIPTALGLVALAVIGVVAWVIR